MDVSVGTRAEIEAVVGTGDTAVALGSGGLAVLGTPRLLAWFEDATCRALHPALGPGETSVGAAVRLEHLAASAVGQRLRVEASVAAVEGRRVVFAVTATDAGGDVVGRGTVERVVVDAERFLARLGPAT